MPDRARPPWKTVHQLKITLIGVSPPIWRRIQVPSDIVLSELHDIIQIVMGWENDHLYQFQIGKVYFSDGEVDAEPALRLRQEFRGVWKSSLSQEAPRKKGRFLYEYDFGDSWKHEILVEEVLPADPRVSYPVCTAGKRACPPEDCGGVWGYEDLLEVMSDPSHEEYEERMEAFGGRLAPEEFDLEAVNRKLKRSLIP
ncbi:MAG: plasmid pRiA4b ORF-3 family protein [Chloroflexi bacterium]|nr:plasmid pRiA4b ORF-3 family protein [Chloroflexota bacterium]